MKSFTDVKLEIFAPQECVLEIRDALVKIGVGHIGDVEYKVEMNCKQELVAEALKVIRAMYLYEEPVINIVPLANHLFEAEK